MEKCLFFTVPGAPKGKGRPRVTKTGHAFTPKDTAEYENLVRLYFTQTYPRHVPITGPIRAEISAYFPIPKSWTKKKRQQWKEGGVYPVVKPDADNIAKSILDSLNNIAFTDDSHVIELNVRKLYGTFPHVDTLIRYDGPEEKEKPEHVHA